MVKVPAVCECSEYTPSTTADNCNEKDIAATTTQIAAHRQKEGNKST
jgi:hypothetical protein